MINLGVREFYIKMTIDGETYDPFSAETLNITRPNYASEREEIIASSRKKFAVPIEEAKRLMMEEEVSIIRSAREKSAITGKKGKKESHESQTEEPLI